MKKIIISLIFLSITQITTSQDNSLYLLIEKPFFIKTHNNISVGFSIKSKDKRFILDYFQFRISNYMGLDENGNDIFLDLKQLRKKVTTDSIKYKTILSLSENKKWWEIHNELSLKKKIFLLEKVKIKDDSGTYSLEGYKEITKYYIIPMIYECTRKNTVPTNLSSK
ncbi:MAG: hypothetical protein HQ471_00945 [Flavobacteriales bacterium]|jgi:hypothetical protein|nr:hypothetical protein [Flavobacteriales bacterium]